MKDRDFGKWSVIMRYQGPLNNVSEDTIEEGISKRYPSIEHLIDDYEIYPDGTGIAYFAWTGDVHGELDDLQNLAREAMRDDYYPASIFELDDRNIDWQGYNPADYIDI